MGLAHGVGLTPLSIFWGMCACVEILLRIQLGIALFTAPLQKREHFVLRNAGWFCVLAMLYTGVFYLGGTQPGPYDASRALQFAIFAALLVICVPVVCHLFEASVWTSLFCCSAGYAVQNLSSGLTELMWILAREPLGLPALSDTVRSGTPYDILTWAATTVVYVACYLLVTRHANRRGLEQVSGRSMLGMMVIVVLMIIGLDLVIKGLCDQGLGLGYAVALRLAHACICIFTVWMEYELLINRRLTEQRNTTERLLTEHERQYETSRRSMNAINARMHDIRHAVMRTLEAAGTSLNASTAHELVHEIDVLDTAVHTGNDALDTVLTQEQLVCRSEGITLSCVADGAALRFMAPADLYTLFDSVLGQAITIEKGTAEPGRRSISVSVREALGAASIHVEGYLAHGLASGMPAGYPGLTEQGIPAARGIPAAQGIPAARGIPAAAIPVARSASRGDARGRASENSAGDASRRTCINGDSDAHRRTRRNGDSDSIRWHTHGSGASSSGVSINPEVRTLVERYSGTLVSSVTEHAFETDILIPLPED